ncbi:MAG TPA: tRNA lysidine(34) synthetase TilS, partial [Opitutaceae bacterium]|nr:tRNA lysidine(34) synthetase TilS [Opitutaceae bacterium]
MSRAPRRVRAFDWRGAAEALAATFPRDRLHPRVVEWSAGRTQAVKGPWGVAFSGGADSLALLLLVWAHWPERRARLRALHFNHGLRGLASAGDERFCRSVCRALNVPFFSDRWRRTKKEKTPSEAQARAARFSFFADVLASEGVGALWTGHHRDDVAESMLMRLARGSGIDGLIAPRPLQASGFPWSHVRPLLTLSRTELRDALARCGVSWREDKSNFEAVFFRNRIRNEVMPVWINAAQGRDAVAGAALSRELLEEDAEALDSWLDELRPLR